MLFVFKDLYLRICFKDFHDFGLSKLDTLLKIFILKIQNTAKSELTEINVESC